MASNPAPLNGDHPPDLDPDLSPEASPEAPNRLGTAAGRVGTRRINQLPLFIVFVAVVLFLGICIAVMYSRSQRQIARNVEEHASAAKQADRLIPKSATWRAAAADPTPPPRPVPPLAPTPTASLSAPTPDPVEAARLAALQNALTSKPALDGVGLTKTAAVSPGDRPDVEAQRLASLRALFGRDGQTDRPGAAPAALPASSARLDHTGLEMFDGAAGKDRWRSGATIENPGRFTLRTGSVIPGVLISGVNSELPGTIIAQVSQNVYDTPTGEYLLLPQGSRLIGAYSANVAYGQSRVFIAWQRVILPDGRALDLGAQPGTDASGYAGFADKTDNHYVRMFGSALLMSAIIGGVSYAQQLNQNQPNYNNVNGGLSNSGSANNNLTQILSQSLGISLGNVVTNLLQKNLSIAPTLTIRPGYRFNVLVVKDFDLMPYEDFQYGKARRARAPLPVLIPAAVASK